MMTAREGDRWWWWWWWRGEGDLGERERRWRKERVEGKLNEIRNEGSNRIERRKEE